MAIVLHSKAHNGATRSVEAEQVVVDPAHYREFVFRCALAICGEPDGAEDVAQEVLLVVLNSRKKLSQVASPFAWVRRVTVRCATRYLKRSRRVDQLQDSFWAPDGSVDQFAVYQVLRSLEPEQRALLGMAINQGLSYREIGEALGIPEGTVASRLNAAKKAFQRKWEQ